MLTPFFLGGRGSVPAGILDGVSPPRRTGALLAALFLLALVGTGVLLLFRLAGDDEVPKPPAASPSTVGLDVEIPTEPLPTAPPAPSTTAAPTSDEEEDEPVVLQGDGLGAMSFAAPVDEVIAALTLRWGPPDSDTGWEPAATSTFGSCPGGEARAVEWRRFWVLFSDGPTPFGPGGKRHFFTWIYWAADLDSPRPDAGGNRPRLATPEGVSVGSAVPQLKQAYGDRLELFDEGPAGPSFGVQTPRGGVAGAVTALDDTGVVKTMFAGGACGD